MGGQSSIAPTVVSCDFQATPRGPLQWRINRRKFHLCKHKGSVLARKAIHNPIPTGEVQGVAGFGELLRSQKPEILSIRQGQRILKLMAGIPSAGALRVNQAAAILDAQAHGDPLLRTGQVALA